jgi:hypothetical protein
MSLTMQGIEKISDGIKKIQSEVEASGTRD